MFVIPDYSYFAVPGFINNMTKYNNRSSSLILHNQMDDQWAQLLQQEDAHLITWLHNKTDEDHNIFLPYSPSQKFITDYFEYFKDIIEPAITRIKQYLIELGIEDVEEYMKDSQEWMSLLFEFQEYQLSTKKVAHYFGLRNQDYPKILIWNNIERKDLILIIPNDNDINMKEYIKSLYWCITMATRQVKKKRLKLEELKEAIELKFSESHHIKNYEYPVKEISFIKSPKNIVNSLKEIGQEYKNNFDAAILNFEEYVKEKSEKSKRMIDLCNQSRKEVIDLLKRFGFYFDRPGANHEIWKHPSLNKPTPVPRSKITPYVLKSIQKDIEEAIQLSS